MIRLYGDDGEVRLDDLGIVADHASLGFQRNGEDVVTISTLSVGTTSTSALPEISADRFVGTLTIATESPRVTTEISTTVATIVSYHDAASATLECGTTSATLAAAHAGRYVEQRTARVGEDVAIDCMLETEEGAHVHVQALGEHFDNLLQRTLIMPRFTLPHAVNRTLRDFSGFGIGRRVATAGGAGGDETEYSLYDFAPGDSSRRFALSWGAFEARG